MKYEKETKEVVERYNKGEGTIAEISESIEGFNRNKFYRMIKKLGIVKDEKKDKYIFTNKNIDGQLNLLKASKKEVQGMEKELETEKEKSEPKEEKKEIAPKEIPKMKKKTFEVSEGVEAGIKMMAAIEGKTINDYVNDTLEKSLSDEIKRMLEETFYF